MSALLRGHLNQAMASASAGAIRLASIQGRSDAEALPVVDDAIAQLLRAAATAMEAIGIDPDEGQRRHLYRDIIDYVDQPSGEGRH